MQAEWLFQIFALIVSNPQLQEQAAGPVANMLANVLPDVTEDHIASFLHKVATKLEAANP